MSSKVPQRTSIENNQRIEANTEQRINYYWKNPARIDHRLGELDKE